jgi:hypothetical protein
VQSGCVHQRSATVSAIIAAARISPSSSEVAVPRACSFNPTRLTCRNELDGDGRRHDAAFVPDKVYVVTTGIRTRQTSGNPEAPGVSSPHMASVNALAGLWLWHIDPAVHLQRIMRNELDSNVCCRFG